MLGEHNRQWESGHERRIPIEKIITHSHYSHFDHDLGKPNKTNFFYPTISDSLLTSFHILIIISFIYSTSQVIGQC